MQALRSLIILLLGVAYSGINGISAASPRVNAPPDTPATDSVFVKTIPSGTGDGSSWDNALDGRYLAWYLREKAIDGTRVFVAEGTYLPYNAGEDTASDHRQYAFTVKQDIEIYGGYKANATGSDLSSYDPKNNITRLSGEIQDDAVASNNSYQVVVITKGTSAIIDGFYISDGYANVNETTYKANGGGVFDEGGNTSILTMSNLVVENNAANFGAGLYINSNYASYLRHTIIRNNTCLITYGGSGIFAWGNFLLENSTVHDNYSSAAVLSWGGEMLIRNSTISGNEEEGVSLDNGSGNRDSIRIYFVGSTITNNGSNGIRIKNYEFDNIRFSMNNTLVVDNQNKDTDFSEGDFPVDTLNLEYSIVSDTMFITSKEDFQVLSVPVSLDTLAYNGGWGKTHRLLDICSNPAVSSGNPDLLNSPLTENDQRGVARRNPPCIGSYDGISNSPHITRWTARGNTNDWNDPGNWDEGLPGPCSSVIIPDSSSFDEDADAHYPVLQEAGGSYPQAVCDTILFEMNSEVARTQFLSYNVAKASLTLLPNRWYMVSAPLRDIYSGDYFVDSSFSEGTLPRQNPSVYARLYQTINPQGNAVAIHSAEWTKSFNTLDVKMEPGSGFSVWIDNGNRTESDFTIRFPQDSLQYWYYSENGSRLWQTPLLTRTDNHRFIYEGAQNYNETTGSFSVKVTSDVSGSEVFGTAIVGNPFMSHLDFDAFQSLNQDKIAKSYQIWGGSSFTTVLSVDGLNISTGDNNFIAPMQSFIVNKISPETPLDSLKFTATLSVTRPATGLRSSGAPNDILAFSISRNGQRQSGIAIRYKAGENNSFDPQKDVWTMFAGNVSKAAVLYALLDGKAASIRTVGDLTEPVELGIRSTEKGILSLRFDHPENPETGFSLLLEDRKTGKTINLKENPVYDFDNPTGNIEGRFFLKIEKAETSFSGDTHQPLRFYQSGQSIQIYSSSEDPILRADVYDTQGRLILSRPFPNNNALQITVPEGNRLVIMRIQTGQQVITKKFSLQ